ncbi:hypothetical protein IGI37_000743 [Enterococcus sp. AZ194]|uniref:ABC transporter permease n=1 Tax=Enterococcus sp. AZ194 TaxID=2774629 RepID=UPI003F25A7EF
MRENTLLALQSIWAHKMRSILTMLGVIIGISAIIAIFCIIEGNTENLKRQIVGGSDNSMLVEYDTKVMFEEGGRPTGKENKPSYLPKYSQKTLAKYKSIAGVKELAIFFEKDVKTYYQNKSVGTKVRAVTPNYFNIKMHSLIKGRKLTQADIDSVSSVVVLEERTYEKLFGNKEGLGKIIEIGGKPYKVVGVVRSEAYAASVLFSTNDLFVPETIKYALSDELDPAPKIWVQGETVDQAKKAAEEVGKLLSAQLPKSDYGFGIVNNSEYEKSMEEMNRSQFLLLAGIASISLIVGGIGVMNIMLVSVTERTREIGVKKALGARKKWILSQFLFESALLTLIGGIVGISFGLFAGKIITQSMGFPFIVSIGAVLGSLLFSIIIGIVFGLIPAIKAAKLSPIEALRYE